MGYIKGEGGVEGVERRCLGVYKGETGSDGFVEGFPRMSVTM